MYLIELSVIVEGEKIQQISASSYSHHVCYLLPCCPHHYGAKASGAIIANKP